MHKLVYLSVAQYILCKATKWQIYAAHLSEGLNGCRHVSNNTDMHLVDTLVQRLYAAAVERVERFSMLTLSEENYTS